MEHTDAIRMNAIERYLLGEMDEDEREIFEEHFFSCGHCVAAINAGTQLMIAGKLVAQEDKAAQAAENVVPIRKRRRWLPQAAAASLLLMIGTQIPRVVPMLGVAQVQAADALNPNRGEPATVEIDLGQSRDEARSAPTAKPGDELVFPVPDDPLALGYVAEIRDERGRVHGREPISRQEAADSVSKRLGELPAGRYFLVVSSVRKGGNRVEIARRVIEVD